MEMWFGMDDEVSCRRRSVVRRSRLDMSLFQEEFTSRRLDRFRTLMKVRRVLSSLTVCHEDRISVTNCMEHNL
jgi:hypothetical protein